MASKNPVRRVLLYLGLVDGDTPPTRVGFGYDVHSYAGATIGRVLVLGGVRFPDEKALAGHSDGDVIAHAVADALLGAAGLGDIGQHFPDTDVALAGADSIGLLKHVAAQLKDAGWRVYNADCTVVLDRPHVAPHRSTMEARLTEAVGAPVSVKATRPEGVGGLGRGEGIACYAVAMVAQR